MHLVREVLDKQILDAEGHRIGKVDGILIEIEPGRQPRISALELGRQVVWERLRSSVGLARKSHSSYRLPWGRVTKVDVALTVDVDRRETPVHRWQTWLRDTIVSRIPGGDS